jgi:hypothetical protein
MRFEIRINQSSEQKEPPFLLVLLFTRKHEDYLNGCEDGIYNCASMITDDNKTLISVIEKSINACLDTYEKDIQKTISEIIIKNEPIQKKFMDMCFPDGVPL